jgi:peptide-methionine (S)-S-oxide reductase
METVVCHEGGELANPTCREVCTHQTGHAEVLQVNFDASKLSYQHVLDAFFDEHNPTQLNRGSRFRSAIPFGNLLSFTGAAAGAAIAWLSAEHKLSKPIVTQVIPADTFWPAEEYHQKYLEKRGAASCHI